MATNASLDTIIAISTGGHANSALSIIRISGFKDLLSFQSAFSFDLKKTKARYSHLAKIFDQDKRVMDEIILVFFPAPHSFTGENVLELQVHGNLINVRRILDLFINIFHLRYANPGEFTLRAFQNKKLSLSQVEGLDLILNANSSLMLDQGLNVLNGELHQTYLQIYDLFLRLRSAVEIMIDFSDDVGDDSSNALYDSTLEELKKIFHSLQKRSEIPDSNLLNPSIVIAGEPNVGKSTLFNLLLSNERSIVSSIPGTTRDFVSESISVDGSFFKLIDTAGIRDSVDPIERIGIDRTMQVLGNAFFRILLLNPVDFNSEYINRVADFEFDLVVFSHYDNPNFSSNFIGIPAKILSTKELYFANFLTNEFVYSGPIEPLKSGPIEPPKSGPIEPPKSGPIEPQKSGPIEPLILKLVARKFSKFTENSPILLERHRNIINKLSSLLASGDVDRCKINDIAVLSNNINVLSEYSSELVGYMSADDVLNSVFSNFCIGK